MTITSRSLRDEIRNLLDYLLEAEIALLQTVVGEQTLPSGAARVSWQAMQAGQPLFTDRAKVHSLDAYRAWVAAGEFSVMLYDGSLLQITYDVSGGAVSGHRLAFIPCPFAVDPAWLQEESPLELLEAYEAEGAAAVLLRSAVRFDYDPLAASPGHPAAHMTLNTVDCRVPCAAPLRLGHFVAFVFDNFYPDIYAAHAYLRTLSRTDLNRRTLTQEESEGVHLNWRAPDPGGIAV